MIKFKYNMKTDLIPLVHGTVVDYTNDFLYGLLPEEISTQLKHCSLYMVCELETPDGLNVYKNPIAIVAPTESRAIETYYEFTKKNNGTVLCELERRCDNIKVEMV